MKRIITITSLIVLLALTAAGIREIRKPKDIRTNFAALQGDCNTDGKVDILDFQLLSNSFGKSSGVSGYNSSCDFNSDLRIDILDFQILSNNFGRSGATATLTANPTSTPTRMPSATLTSIPNTPAPTVPPVSGNFNFIVDKDNTGGKGCSDSGAGDVIKPFCTITHAISVAQPGNTIAVRKGIYPSFEVSKSGSSTGYITLTGYQSEKPTVSGGSNGITLNGKSYIRISGFEVKGATGSYGAGIMIEGGSHHNIIENSIIHDNLGVRTHGVIITGSNNNKVMNSQVYNNYSVGLKMQGGATGNEFSGNTVYHNVGDPPNSDGIAFSNSNTKGNLVKNNRVYDNGDDGIDTWDTGGQTIIGNVVYSNRGGGDGNGFKLGGTDTGGNNLVIGNVSYNNKRDGFDSNHSGNNKYYNNVAYGNSGVGYEDVNKFASCTLTSCRSIYINNIGMNNGRNFSAGPFTYTSHNNLWYSDSGGADVYYEGKSSYSTLSAFYSASGNRLDNPNGGTLSSLSANPLFLSASSANFRLTSGSPAINKGDPANPGGIQTVGVPDIGAFEYGL